jgi:hypothetical protein
MLAPISYREEPFPRHFPTRWSLTSFPVRGNRSPSGAGAWVLSFPGQLHGPLVKQACQVLVPVDLEKCII